MNWQSFLNRENVGGFALGLCVTATLVIMARFHHTSLAQTHTNVSSLVSFDPAVFDFGAVPQGTKVYHDYQLVNKSTNEIRIVAIHTTCSCTVVSSNLLGNDIPENSQITIPIVLDSRTRDGPSLSGVDLILEAANGTKYLAQARLSGEVLADFELDPPVVDFGIVRPGGHFSQSVVLRPKLLKSIRLDGVKAADPEIDARIVSGQGKVPLQLDHISISFQAPLVSQHELFSSSIQVKCSSKRTPIITIGVHALVQPEVEILPGVLVLSRNNLEESSAITVQTSGLSKVVKVVLQGEDGTMHIPSDTFKYDDGWKLVHSLNLPNSICSGMRKLNFELEVRNETGRIEARSAIVQIKGLTT